MELNDILNKMENEGWQIDSDFKYAHKPFLQYFLETIEEQCNRANVSESFSKDDLLDLGGWFDGSPEFVKEVVSDWLNAR